MIRTRFAPSPTGPLHLGHAYCALTNFEFAKQRGGEFLLRIEDIDQTRSKREWEQSIFDDLNWLKIQWHNDVIWQSKRCHLYQQALDFLWSKNLLYVCTCNRNDIKLALDAPQEGIPLHGPDGLIYPGTCRNKAVPKQYSPRYNLRLNVKKAIKLLPPVLTFQECNLYGQTFDRYIYTENLPKSIGDVVLSRAGLGTSYHLSVVVDDHEQAITHVMRGSDLLESTQIHVLLQHLFRYNCPVFYHHSLVRDDNGKRLAKRDDARSIKTYREMGYMPQDLNALIQKAL